MTTTIEPCTDDTHIRAKTDPATWVTLTYRDVWVFDAGDGEPPTRCEMRDCPKCGSTLLREVP